MTQRSSMSALEETTKYAVAQLQQQYDMTSREKEECEAVLKNTDDLILQLEQEKEALMIQSKQRERDEDEQWVRFQAQYDGALKDKERCESVFTIKDQVVIDLEKEKEKIMELQTNKETEVRMAKWQEEYDNAIKEKDGAAFHLHQVKERLTELREGQSVYLKERGEEDAAMWKEFQGRYTAALEGKKDCEMKLKSKAEEMLRLQDEKKKVAEVLMKEDTKCAANSLPLAVVSSSPPQSHEDDKHHVSGGGGDVSVLTGPSLTMSNAAIAAIRDAHNISGEGEVSTLSHRNHMMAYSDSNDDDDDTSLGATTIASIPSRAIEYKKDLSALDKFLPAAQDENSGVSGRSNRSVSSRSVRRRDVIKPIDLFDEKIKHSETTPAKQDIVVAKIDDTTERSVSSRSVRRRDVIKPIDLFDEKINHSEITPAKQDMVVAKIDDTTDRSVSSRSVRRRDVIKPIDLFDEKINHSETTPAKQGMMVAKIDDTADEKHLSPWAYSNDGVEDGIDIVEQSNPQCDQQLALVVHNPKQRTPRPTNLEPEEGRAALQLGNDPPGESPKERPYIDPNDDAIYDSSSVSYIGGGGRFRNVQWVDPKNVHVEDIDFDILKAYERMTDRGVANDQPPYNSLEQQQQLLMDPPEDLPRNNYYPGEDDSSSKARMTKASIIRDNRRIRIATISAGYKTANFFVREDLDTRIYFHELEDAINYMSRRGYARMKKDDEREWFKLLARAHGVVKTGPTKKKQRYRKGKLVMILSKEISDDEYQKAQHCDSSETNTERTSLGRSVRCGFKSYSEKFLAEQEAAKRNSLLLLCNGADVDGAGHLLQLTNGEVMSAVDEATLESSKDSMGSDRKGVYCGGVRYFTSDDNNDDDSEDDFSGEDRSDEGEDSEEELDKETDGNESNIYQESEEQEEMYEVGSMGSMLSDEDSFRDDRSAGVVSASSTLSTGYPAPLQRKGTYREPPRGLTSVNDESVAS